MVEIAQWQVVVCKNPVPEEANDESLSWKVLNKIKFKSGDPAEWGEFRAYGGGWTRCLNRTYDEQDVMSDSPPGLNPKLKNKPRKKEIWGQLETGTYLPFWGLTLGPPKVGGLAWRLANDQHMEIFYAAPVPKVPRSKPRSKERLSDDDNEPNDSKKARCPWDLTGLGTDWHIIARDEPCYGPVQIGDFVEYWHRGEFQIRDPMTKQILPQRKQIYLRVNGTFPNWVYRKAIDTTENDMPASWELAISSPEDRYKTKHYRERGISIPSGRSD